MVQRALADAGSAVGVERAVDFGFAGTFSNFIFSDSCNKKFRS